MLTFDELLKYAKRTIKEMHDDTGNIKLEYQELINKVNNTTEYSELISKLADANTTEEIELLRTEFEYEKYKNLSEKEKISKLEGALFIFIYVAYLAFAIVRNYCF